jgi:hypothetical protein
VPSGTGTLPGVQFGTWVKAIENDKMYAIHPLLIIEAQHSSPSSIFPSLFLR